MVRAMTEPDYQARAAAAVAALQRWYVRRTGLWKTTGWWNAANALTAVIRYTRHTGDRSHARVLETTFRHARRRHPGFVNMFFDDNGWWGLAWVAAYDLTGETGTWTRPGRFSRAIWTAGTARAAAGCGGTPSGPTRTRSPTSCSSRSRRSCTSGRPPTGVPVLGAAGLGVADRTGPDRPGRPGQRRAHGGLRQQRRHRLDLQPGRDPRRAGRAATTSPATGTTSGTGSSSRTRR